MSVVTVVINDLKVENIEVVPKAINVFSIDDIEELIPETRLRVGVD